MSMFLISLPRLPLCIPCYCAASVNCSSSCCTNWTCLFLSVMTSSSLVVEQIGLSFHLQLILDLISLNDRHPMATEDARKSVSINRVHHQKQCGAGQKHDHQKNSLGQKGKQRSGRFIFIKWPCRKYIFRLLDGFLSHTLSSIHLHPFLVSELSSSCCACDDVTMQIVVFLVTRFSDTFFRSLIQI